MPFSCYSRSGFANKSVSLNDCVDTRILKAMADKMNFTYQVFEPLDGQWGYRLPNNSFTGKILNIINNN